MAENFNSITLYEDPKHKFMLLGWEEIEEDGVVQTNQYVIVDGNELVLLDPGGAHVFPRVLAAVAEIGDISQVKQIFYSHQDPDVSSGITLWLSMLENVKIHISGLWLRFLPHFGVYDKKRVFAIPDKGSTLAFSSGAKMEFIPSHFLHSTGCFSLYDTVSKGLFTGDIGAAVFGSKRYPIVQDFHDHTKIMEAFHKRYMSSNRATKAWVEKVSRYPLDFIAPQHGAIFKGDNVAKFLAWFKDLKCGVDVLENVY